MKLFGLILLAFNLVNCSDSEKDFFLMKNDFDVNRRVSDGTFEMIRENYSKVASTAKKYDVEVENECGGMYKKVQHLIQSPGYAEREYPNNFDCMYTFMSPFVCNNHYHVQFIDFNVEPSLNCSKDFVKIGENEILCGQVIGIKKYEAPNGILKIHFSTDDNGAMSGFQLLVTRLACKGESETSTVFPVYQGRSISSNSRKNISNRQDILPDFDPNKYNPYNPSMPPTMPGIYPPFNGCNQCCSNPGFPQYPSYPQLPPPSYYPPPSYIPPIGQMPQQPGGFIPQPPGSYLPQQPGYIPQPPGGFIPQPPGYYPPMCSTCGTLPNPGYLPVIKEPEFNEIEENKTQSLPQFAPGYPISPPVPGTFPPFMPGYPNPGIGIQQCCRNVFRSRRFYLLSPNFPLNNRQPSDCVYVIERTFPNICRLRINFRFFNHGDCFNDFVEIDGQRVCGCRTGAIVASQWGYGPKIIRYRNSGYGRGAGFVMDIFQETCPYRLENSPNIAEKRMDILQIQSNTTTTSTYYSPSVGEASAAEHPAQVQELAEDKEPSEKFFLTTPRNGQCTLNTLDWILLKKSALFIGSPVCYRY